MEHDRCYSDGMTQAYLHPGRHDERSYLFLGGSLALDLVNTEVMVRGQPRDLLVTPADLDAWWQQARAHHPTLALAWPDETDNADIHALERTKELRRSLRHVFEALARGEGISAGYLEPVNHVLATGYQALDMTAEGVVQARWHSRDAGAGGALLAVALSAVDLLTTKDPARLHRCENVRCILLFYDTTKSGTRRWCSTGCMDRSRSLVRYRQRKGQGS
jgi:predicted RNA-binding Zn ribbon-like protein